MFYDDPDVDSLKITFLNNDILQLPLFPPITTGMRTKLVFIYKYKLNEKSIETLKNHRGISSLSLELMNFDITISDFDKNPLEIFKNCWI